MKKRIPGKVLVLFVLAASLLPCWNAVDSSGNAYAVGYINLDGVYKFGSKSVSGPCSLGGNPRNAVLVRLVQ